MMPGVAFVALLAEVVAVDVADMDHWPSSYLIGVVRANVVVVAWMWVAQ